MQVVATFTEFHEQQYSRRGGGDEALTIAEESGNVEVVTRVIYGRASRIIRQRFSEYGLTLQGAHATAIDLMLLDFAALIAASVGGALPGTYAGEKMRRAIPLPPGAGKSQGILATITALYQLRREHLLPFTVYPVLVAASKVSDLVSLIRDLENIYKVPASEIGLLHAKRYERRALDATGNLLDTFADTHAERPSDGEDTESRWFGRTGVNPQSKPFLFCTHQRLRPVSGQVPPETKYRRANGELITRAVAYDESLMTASPWTVNVFDLSGNVAWLGEQIERGLSEYTTDKQASTRQDRRDLLAFLVECVRTVKAVVQRQEQKEQHERNGVEIVSLPERTEQDFDKYKRGLAGLHTKPPTSALSDFLDMAWQPVRVRYGTSSDTAAINFTIATPPGLDRILVLDASYPVRILEQLDEGITVNPADCFTAEGLSQIKSCSSITASIIRTGGGRRAVERAMSQEDDSARTYSREIVSILQSIPANERTLIVTYKSRMSRRSRNRFQPGRRPKSDSVDIVHELRGDLERAGVDLSRVAFLTWGQETSTNRYQDFENIILAGILQRSDTDLLAAAIGQSRNLRRPEKSDELYALRVSESAHFAFQAIMRTRARRMIAPRTSLPVRAWMLYHDPKHLRRNLERVMPDITWAPHHTVAIKEHDPDSRRGELAKVIAAHLDSLPADVQQKSTRSVKREIPAMVKLARMTFTRAAALAPKYTAHWRISKSSFVRATSITVNEGKVGEVIPSHVQALPPTLA